MALTISLLHATYRSGAAAVALRDSWMESASSPELVEHIFALDADDELSMYATQGCRRVVNPASPARVSAGTWSRDPATAPSFGILSLWADSTGALWAAGTGGSIAVLRGLGWNPIGSGSTNRFRAISGDPDGYVWSVSDGADIVRVDPRGVPSAFPSDATVGLYGVCSFGKANAWAVGAGGSLLHFDGVSWQSRSSGTGFDLYAIWGAAPDDIWVVGDRGTLLHFDGSAWSAPNGLMTADLTAVWAASNEEAWAVGAQGTILHRVGGSWGRVSSASRVDLSAVWGTAEDDIWITGDGVLMHWDGASLKTVTDLAAGATALSGRGATDIWALSGGSASHWDGTDWTSLEERASLSIFEAATDEVWVASLGGQASAGRWDGRVWTAFPLTGCLRLDGSGPGDIWCVGGTASPRVNHWDGSQWGGLSVPSDAALNGVASAGPGSMWYVGVSGVLGTCTSTGCKGLTVNGDPTRRVFMDDDLTAVAVSGQDVFVVGDRGTILHRRP